MADLVVVAIPVRDEEDCIGACLEALVRQTVSADEIILLLNNCQDRTAQVARRFSASLPGLNIMQRQLEGPAACAGEARRLAIIEAAARAGRGVVLTTDADGIVPDDWISRNLNLIAGGAEAVCGRAVMSPADARLIPPHLHDQEALSQTCRAALDELLYSIDPDPADPWPRHQDNSGASIAVTAAALARAGGPPRVHCGEDRALIAALSLVDARIRHAPEIAVTVSGRLDGRAAGGMAATISRRIATPDEWADETLEPAVDAYRRALARARLRALWAGAPGLAELGADLLIGTPALRAALRSAHFGGAWALVQALSPVLARRRLPMSELRRQMRQAVLLRHQHQMAEPSRAQYAV